MHRRDFMFGCAASALAVSLPAAPADASPRFYARARLVDPGGRPLEARSLAANRNFIFHYPFAGTPCFLLNLGRPTKPSAHLKTADSHSYQWPGGVGADHGIVAYSARRTTACTRSEPWAGSFSTSFSASTSSASPSITAGTPAPPSRGARS